MVLFPRTADREPARAANPDQPLIHHLSLEHMTPRTLPPAPTSARTPAQILAGLCRCAAARYGGTPYDEQGYAASKHARGETSP